MTIWIIALLLLGCLGLVGYYQGAIKVSFSLLGLLVALLTAIPLGSVLQPLVRMVGIKNPYLDVMIAPAVAFILIMAVFKIAAMFAHNKVVVWYKYNQPEFRFLVWERMNQRVGSALGAVNAMIYTFLIATVIYTLGYMSTQMETEENAAANPMLIGLLNRAARDVNAAKMDRVAAVFNPMPESYYDAADVLGHVYHQPLLQSRMGRYPAFLALAERPEFRELSKDKEFQELFQSQGSLGELLKHEKVKVIVNSEEIREELLKIDTKDLLTFIRTGESRFDEEPILGRWRLDPNSLLSTIKQLNPKIGSQMMGLYKAIVPMITKTFVMVVTPDHQVLVKGPGMAKGMMGGAPDPAAVPADPGALMQSLNESEVLSQGEWKKEGDQYSLTGAMAAAPNQAAKVTVVGNALTMKSGPAELVFIREQ